MMTIWRDFLADPTFWVMLSTLLCFGFIGYKAWRPIIAALDARAEAIRHNLAEAEALRREAEEILAEYKKRSANALREAEDIIQKAGERATQLRIQMESDLKQAIARQEANAKMRIARLESDAIESVKATLIKATLAQAAKNIEEGVENAKDVGLSLDAIEKTLH